MKTISPSSGTPARAIGRSPTDEGERREQSATSVNLPLSRESRDRMPEGWGVRPQGARKRKWRPLASAIAAAQFPCDDPTRAALAAASQSTKKISSSFEPDKQQRDERRRPKHTPPREERSGACNQRHEDVLGKVVVGHSLRRRAITGTRSREGWPCAGSRRARERAERAESRRQRRDACNTINVRLAAQRHERHKQRQRPRTCT